MLTSTSTTSNVNSIVNDLTSRYVTQHNYPPTFAYISSATYVKLMREMGGSIRYSAGVTSEDYGGSQLTSFWTYWGEVVVRIMPYWQQEYIVVGAEYDNDELNQSYIRDVVSDIFDEQVLGHENTSNRGSAPQDNKV